MSHNNTILVNKYGGLYELGMSLQPAQWANIAKIYDNELKTHGECSVRRLAHKACVSTFTALKAINTYELGLIIPPVQSRGHGRKGVGTIVGLKICHHVYIYKLYLENPSLPLVGYIEKNYDKFGLVLTRSFIESWFLNIGPFKGTMRVTSTFPSGRNSASTYNHLCSYLEFIMEIGDPIRLVFADEKPMKEIDIYGTVRRNVVTGVAPNHEMEANAKNRYNILATTTLKANVRAVEYIILSECTDSTYFVLWVQILLQKGTLVAGDVFIVDNCTIHTQGDATGLHEALFDLHGVLMITLPPYHPDYNPTELVFGSLLVRMKSERARYMALSNDDFKFAIGKELENFTTEDIRKFYNFMGYR